MSDRAALCSILPAAPPVALRRTLVILGAPKGWSSSALRPLGPSVTCTASASRLTPLSMSSRACERGEGALAREVDAVRDRGAAPAARPAGYPRVSRGAARAAGPPSAPQPNASETNLRAEADVLAGGLRRGEGASGGVREAAARANRHVARGGGCRRRAECAERRAEKAEGEGGARTMLRAVARATAERVEARRESILGGM